ncbi:hypothetical protein QYF61_014562 [Mycteria americana]|uniref:Reverse transcriptase domain-containing protein n=1 Tax=Mycteria americana TaxID=33587 RepID=A0AAN7Q3P2_MYCAM|nr:hypothetical protein QYF61_014562 [Mycteria americana]
MKGKAHLSLKPFKDVKDKKMDFYRYIGSGRKTKATTDEGHGKGWVFICKVCCQLALQGFQHSLTAFLWLAGKVWTEWVDCRVGGKKAGPPGSKAGGLTVGPILFNLFVSDLRHGRDCIFRKFVGELTSFAHLSVCVLGSSELFLKQEGRMTPGFGDHLTQESGTASQRDPSKLGEWASKNLMTFSRSKCEVLHPGYKIPAK